MDKKLIQAIAKALNDAYGLGEEAEHMALVMLDAIEHSRFRIVPDYTAKVKHVPMNADPLGRKKVEKGRS